MAEQYADPAYSLLPSAGAAAPGFYAGRAEQHLAGGDIFRSDPFDAQSTCPIGDLAHHWEVSPDGLRWHFYIRSTLFWHNGDPIKTSQLQQRLLMLLQLPALRTLFASISEISVTHSQCLTITLHRADYWLPFRLASYCSVLAHPDDPAIGSGPFRLKRFTPDLVRLENHQRYISLTRCCQAVEYWITAAAVRAGSGHQLSSSGTDNHWRS